MSKRNTQLRRHAISNMVNELGEVSVDELAQKFETSEVTIRKDLASLEKMDNFYADTVVRLPSLRKLFMKN